VSAAGDALVLIECVPNLSTADASVRDGAVAMLAERAGIEVLDASSDVDHGRSVITFVGPSESVVAAAVALAAFARDRIDLRRHAGVHRRMGALDVCPFVPLRASEMPVAVAAARLAASAIAREVGVPVFLYGEARRRAERAVLGVVRNRGFEALVELVGVDPIYTPDEVPEGPVQMHASAGAVACGARPFLIAWNVELGAGADLALAQRIARAVRESSGGLPGVQAMGFWLASKQRAQVSCNLLDAGRAAGGLPAVFAAIAEQAVAAGAEAVASELIGLAPAEALDAEIARTIRLPGFDPSRHTVEGVLAARRRRASGTASS
jgi:glutamate formiminotransferase